MLSFIKTILSHTKNTFMKSVVQIPFFYILLLLLFIISALNIRSEYALLGWDNYSSFLNIDSNTLRSLFSTWREYRGLGVVSDAEVTDIWRNIYYLLGQHIIPNNLLEQLYYLFSLNVGMILMYKLASYIFTKANKDKKLSRYTDVFSFIASLFYLFNINTLSVFYFPMLMFVSRFFALPTTVYVVLKFIHERTISIPKSALYIGLLFISSIAYIVPTIFITMMIVLSMIAFSHRKNLIRSCIVLGIFVIINSYWLFPFINYTIQKSEDIKHASTFVRMNEDFLNKNESYYNIERSVLMVPQFYDMRYVESATSELKMYHPLFEQYAKSSISLEKGILWLFPVLYIFGCGILILKSIRSSQWLWIPGTVLTFVFLSMNEFGLLGFLYNLLSKNIPLFEVVFRFGDTKFHSIIAFAGSIAAAYAIVQIAVWIGRLISTIDKKKIVAVVALLILVPNAYVYRGYFEGQLIGFYMYNQIPEAYSQISKRINSDPQEGRVVHFPIDKTGYWKSYSWGYFGSAFLQYMLEKPLIDKTFEPASIENWSIIERMSDLQSDIQSITDEKEQMTRATQMYELLSMADIRYVILDGTISARVSSRGIDVWDTTNYPNSEKMTEFMEQAGPKYTSSDRVSDRCCRNPKYYFMGVVAPNWYELFRSYHPKRCGKCNAFSVSWKYINVYS
ncbi:MAG: hypothetical protein US54_C0053G0008 [Candidatus Roizmanbacteria bacterium GW2011_GWA2_37_7]|uniref:Glycosyltransferase RgtA/B/C/D-like domain-containing protein n=1 Tax=Candidatus Roizmanbacteria bacterium GW2011_GWA2_37_7 TaxID=1618481 RepID=A0A0G0H3V6_9BACT|nr:MAG: hypothetical protein US54_C0053G0008 [Candidatus Roizmanbacteria bacterium GW2011_GWA2_37_7]